MKKIKIAVLSDLHCHAPHEFDGKNESFLTVGSPRIPENRHPVQALIDLAKKKNLSADVILCPGDMANKSSSLGLSHAWDLLRNDVKTAFNASTIFSTLGNHDVSSRSVGISPFHDAQVLNPDFPFADTEDKNQYWTQGFCLKTVNEVASFLIINTTYDHYGADAAQKGTFDHSRITDLDNYLDTQTLHSLRIAVFHHHPILHSIVDFDSSNLLPTGDQLLDVLSKYRFNLIVHGHRHCPRIRRHLSKGHEFHVFCSGSFSAFLAELGSRTRNSFHLIHLSSEGDFVKGVINTWEFNYGGDGILQLFHLLSSHVKSDLVLDFHMISKSRLIICLS